MESKHCLMNYSSFHSSFFCFLHFYFLQISFGKLVGDRIWIHLGYGHCLSFDLIGCLEVRNLDLGRGVCLIIRFLFFGVDSISDGKHCLYWGNLWRITFLYWTRWSPKSYQRSEHSLLCLHVWCLSSQFWILFLPLRKTWLNRWSMSENKQLDLKCRYFPG